MRTEGPSAPRAGGAPARKNTGAHKKIKNRKNLKKKETLASRWRRRRSRPPPPPPRRRRTAGDRDGAAPGHRLVGGCGARPSPEVARSRRRPLPAVAIGRAEPPPPEVAPSSRRTLPVVARPLTGAAGSRPRASLSKAVPSWPPLSLLSPATSAVAVAVAAGSAIGRSRCYEGERERGGENERREEVRRLGREKPRDKVSKFFLIC